MTNKIYDQKFIFLILWFVLVISKANLFCQDQNATRCMTIEEYLKFNCGFKSKQIPNSDASILYKNVNDEKEALSDCYVKIRYWDGWRYKKSEGYTDYKINNQKRPVYTLILKIGDGTVGKGIEEAILGMKTGDKREVFMPKEYAMGIEIARKDVAYIEIELLEVSDKIIKD